MVARGDPAYASLFFAPPTLYVSCQVLRTEYAVRGDGHVGIVIVL